MTRSCTRKYSKRIALTTKEEIAVVMALRHWMRNGCPQDPDPEFRMREVGRDEAESIMIKLEATQPGPIHTVIMMDGDKFVRIISDRPKDLEAWLLPMRTNGTPIGSLADQAQPCVVGLNRRLPRRIRWEKKRAECRAKRAVGG